MHQLDAVELQQLAQEVACGDAEPALDVRDEDDCLTGSLGRECLSCCQPPPDLRLRSQQLVVDQ
jgi:hypothetical protein